MIGDAPGEEEEEKWVPLRVHDRVARQLFANIPASCLLGSSSSSSSGIAWGEWFVALVDLLNSSGCMARLHIHVMSREEEEEAVGEEEMMATRYLLGGCFLLHDQPPPPSQLPPPSPREQQKEGDKQ